MTEAAAGRGRLTVHDNDAEVVFERLLDAPMDRVWDLIATGDGLARWLAPAEVDLEAGRVDIDFGESGLAGGAVIDLKVGEVLEYHWGFPGEPDSVIRFELSDAGGKTRLRLHHRLLPLDQAPGYGAGWHAHLDHLEDVAVGRTPDDWTERFNTLRPLYGESGG